MLRRARDINELYNKKVNALPWDMIWSGITGAYDSITGNDKKKQEDAAAKAKAEAEAAAKAREKELLANINDEKKSSKIPLYAGLGIGGVALTLILLKR